VTDRARQLAGIDHVVLLDEGRRLLVDVKTRERRWPDILVERWSDVGRRVPGWAFKDLECDYIAYAFLPNGPVHLLPHGALRAVAEENISLWECVHRVIDADNGSYVTRSIAVPTSRLLADVEGSITVPTLVPDRQGRLFNG
jgi:hypothetical protein